MCDGLIRFPRRAVPVAIIALAVVLAGCSTGDSDASAASSSLPPPSPSAASETASPTASPTDTVVLDADHIFSANVDRYGFVELPRTVERQARRQFEASAGLDSEDAKLDLRSLTKDGIGDSLVLVVTLSPEYGALPGSGEGFVRGMAGSAGSEPEEIALGGTTGYVVDNDEQQIVAWQDHNLLVAVFSERRATAVAAARAIVEATG